MENPINQVDITKEEETSEIFEDKKQPRMDKPGKLARLWSPLIFVLFSLAFFLLYVGGQAGLEAAIRDISNPDFIDSFKVWSPYAGILAALVSALIYFILLGIKRLVGLKKFVILNPIFVFISFLPWFLLGRQLVYFEPRYTDIAKALISFVGEPLYQASVFAFILTGIWLAALIVLKLTRLRAKTAVVLVMLLLGPMVLTGCVGQFMAIACDFFPDSEHCWQGAAVQEGQVAECEKVSGEKFAGSGSNPPRDKCYLMIAENTGDLSACDQIKGGLMSYSREECLLNASVKFSDPSGCNKLAGATKADCLAQIGPKLDPGAVIEYDDQIALIKEELKKGADPGLEEQLAGLEAKRQEYLGAMSADVKANYESLSDPRNRQASLDYHLGKIDAKTRDTLVALNDKLRADGNSMNEKDYAAMRDLLAYKNAPENDIEQMDDKELLKQRWNEKLGNAVDYLKFWNANPTPAEKKYDESLFFYERMLERQTAIDKGLSERQQDVNRNLDMVKNALKDKAWETSMDYAKQAAFGELTDLVNSSAEAPVTAVLGEAIDTVKKEAKSAEFRGLVRAYDLGMQEELAKAGGDVERAHAAVVANLQKDPYMYEDKNTFAKYGNLLENKDCDGSNPHCISRDVFWKAMKKSYKYQNKI